MSEAGAILTREELAAILGDSKLKAERDRLAVAATKRPRPFARALTAWADEQSRLVATVHQRPIHFELVRATTMPVAEFAAGLVLEDRAFALRLAGMRGAGAIAIGRSLLFGWLTMAFGAPPALDVPVPLRGYTRIETRFLRRLVEELVGQLGRSLADVLPGRCEVGELLEPELLPEFLAPRLYSAAFEVAGIGELGRLRIAFPESWIDEIERGAQLHNDEDTIGTEQLLNVPVELRAEVGRAELSIRQIGALEVGDEIPIDGYPDGTVLVRVAGKPRFKAVRGSAGTRAAIQIQADSAGSLGSVGRR
jgi:flagellar motor switch protein FliM